MTAYDLIIIGGGPSGLNVGLAAEKAGLNTLILEKGVLVNSIYHFPTNMTFFSTSKKLEIGDIPFISHSDKPSRAEALEYYRRVSTSNRLNINLYEEVKSVNKTGNSFAVNTSKDKYEAGSVIVSTGFYDIPKLLEVPGEELPKVSHYYKEAHPYTLQEVAVVGASNSAVDAALEIYRKGGQVTMIVRGPEIGERVKYWVRPDIINRIEEGSIKAYFNAEVIEIQPDRLRIKSPDGEFEIANDYLLALTGYQPNFDFLTAMGIQLSEDERRIPAHDPETMESNVKGIYLAGVICGGMETHKWFIENSRVHAKLIIEQIKARSIA